MMKNQIRRITFATMIAIATLINYTGISLAGSQSNNIPINPNIPSTINPNIHPTFPPNPTTIYGEVAVDFGHYASQGSLQCKNLSVVLYSEQTLPASPPKPGDLFQLPGKPIFSVSNKLSGNLNTGKCSYSIYTNTKYIGKKAKLDFRGGGDYTDGAKSVNIPSQPLNINTETTFGRIG